MTARTENATVVSCENSLADEQQQQRASAPTLRDLRVARPSVPPSKNASEISRSRQPELAAPEHT